MTPVVFFVRPETRVGSVIDDLLTCAVHRLFVVDEHEVLIGVISALDLLRHQHAALSDRRARQRSKRARSARTMLRRRPKRFGRPVTSGSDIVMADTGQ